ncbi:nuclear speckle splicing regulatory 1 [Brachionus plicatilis]|uniref:Nuclear speckle splicing regulatory 1 n=1 Tax=Brachionus plicatilis TaxID=10195 RepID=A0A3M7Q7H5_BRAPC|nr:nuclear speckle splicing regulatory 1 [Brachionus plicatilis]
MNDKEDSIVNKPSGPVFTNPNKKYGLVIPSKTKTQSKPKSAVRPCIFNEDEDEESETQPNRTKKTAPTQVNTSSSILKKQTQIQIEKALQEDKSVFEYDEIYDELEKEKMKINPKAKNSESKEPKYIVGIMKAAAKRKMEFERVQDRKIQKEREEEGDLWADKEVFVTAAYRQKMEERQKIEEEERRQEQIENLLDVRKQKDLSGFYFSLLKMKTGEWVIEEEAEKEKRLEKERLESVKFKETKSGIQKAYRSKNEEESEAEEEVEEGAKEGQTDEQKISKGYEEEPDAKKIKQDQEKENKPMVQIKTEEEEREEKIKETLLSKEELRKQRLEKLFTKRTVGSKLDNELSEYFQRKAILTQKNYIEKE